MKNSTGTCSSCWKKRSGLEKSLMLILIGSILISLILCTAQFLVITRTHFVGSGECNSKVCIKASSVLLNFMDASVSPCDNFYQFACGNFLKQKFIPFSENEIDIGQEIINKIEMQVIDLLDNSQTKHETFSKVQRFFKACMNETEIKRRGFEPIHRVFKFIGGWPMLDGNNWNEKTFDWIEVLKKLKQIGLYGDYLINIELYIFQSNTHLLIEAAFKDNFPTYLLANSSNQVYKAIGELIGNYIEILGGDKNSISVKKDIYDFLEFYRSFKEIEIQDDVFDHLTVATMQEKYPDIRWLELINIAMPLVHANNDTLVHIYVPVTMKKLEKLIGQTSKRTIANYIAWKTLERTIDMLPNDLYEEKTFYDRVAAGIHDRPLRWQICIRKVKKYFTPAIIEVYKNKYLNDVSLNELDDIKTNVQTKAQEIIQSIDLKEGNDFKESIKLNISINLPTEFLNKSFVDNLYKEIEINENFYFETELSIKNKFYKQKSYSSENDGSYFDEMIIIGVKKIPSVEYVISPIVFRDIYYTYGRPNAINYAGVGYNIAMKIAHEIQIAFKSKKEKANQIIYNQQRQCFREQIDSYNYSGIRNEVFDINYTIDLHHAINFGTYIAYATYNKWIDDHKQDLKLYGVPYTDRQLFWINFAQINCHKRNTHVATAATNDIRYFIDSPIIVMGPLRNSKEFAQDFQCPIGSYMNPHRKCEFISTAVGYFEQ